MNIFFKHISPFIILFILCNILSCATLIPWLGDYESHWIEKIDEVYYKDHIVNNDIYKYDIFKSYLKKSRRHPFRDKDYLHISYQIDNNFISFSVYNLDNQLYYKQDILYHNNFISESTKYILGWKIYNKFIYSNDDLIKIEKIYYKKSNVLFYHIIDNCEDNNIHEVYEHPKNDIFFNEFRNDKRYFIDLSKKIRDGFK